MKSNTERIQEPIHIYRTDAKNGAKRLKATSLAIAVFIEKFKNVAK